MKLSLVFPAWFQEFGSFERAAKKVSAIPPLNLCIVGALAEEAGWEVQLIDAHVEVLGHQTATDRVAAFKPDLIGLTCTTPFFPSAVQVARMLKEHLDAPIIVGGTHISVCREKAFEDCFDYLFIGECETTFPEFVRRFAEGDRSPEVPGLMTRRNGDFRYAGDAPFLADLDQAPLAARHLLPNEKYFVGTPRGRKRHTTLQTSRGCPFSCVFCACDIHGTRVRQRSVENVMEEIEVAIRRDGAEHIYFIDDTFTLNRKFLFALCDEIERRNLKFTFECNTTANLWAEPLVKRLKECGLIRVSFGLESADPEVRKLIKKKAPLDSYATSNRLSNSLGIETINSVIIGLPGDTRESIERTVDYLCESRDLQHVTLNIAMPYPGTEMLRWAEQGMHGLKLVEHDFSKYQRYGHAVMEVNGIKPEELIKLQKRALVKVYSRWWRIIPTLKRFGFATVLFTALDTLVVEPIRKLFGRGKKG